MVFSLQEHYKVYMGRKYKDYEEEKPQSLGRNKSKLNIWNFGA